jgi:hypothetical protein
MVIISAIPEAAAEMTSGGIIHISFITNDSGIQVILKLLPQHLKGFSVGYY